MIMPRLDSYDILVEHYLEVIDFQKEFKSREIKFSFSLSLKYTKSIDSIFGLYKMMP